MDPDRPSSSPTPQTLVGGGSEGTWPQEQAPVSLSHGTRSPTPGLFATSFHGLRGDKKQTALLDGDSLWAHNTSFAAPFMMHQDMRHLNPMDRDLTAYSQGDLSGSRLHDEQIQTLSPATLSPDEASSTINLATMRFDIGERLEIHPDFQDMTVATDIDLGAFDMASSRDESDSAIYKDGAMSDSNIALGMSLTAPSDSSIGSAESFTSTTPRRNRRRRRRNVGARTRAEEEPSERKYQCTFCTDRFKTKYDWQRHETSVHLSLEQWQCAKFGPVVQETDGSTSCVFCGELHPDPEHHSLHNYSLCLARPVDERIFRRKDHLRQHLRIVHNGSSFIKKMEDWFSSIERVNSRCGFCDVVMTSWADRQKHLARHFKQGADMKDWEGDRGFDDEIDKLIENDMPVFMIGDQRKTMEPFSGTQASHFAGPSDLDFNKLDGDVAMPNEGAASWEWFGPLAQQTVAVPHSYRQVESALLALVKHELNNGRVPTDDELKKKTSDMIFGPDNDWDQTWADNPQWLESFKKKAGLISLPYSGGRNAFVGLDAMEHEM